MDVDIATTNFITKFKHIFRSCSNTCYQNAENVQKLKPWITQGLINSIQERDKLKQTLLKRPNDIILTQKYKKYRNLTTKLIQKTKNNYYKTKIQEAVKDVRKMWTIIKEFTNENKTHNKFDKIRLENGTVTENKTEISYVYNKYFSEIGRKMAQEIQINNSHNINFDKNTNTTLNSLFLSPDLESEIIICTYK